MFSSKRFICKRVFRTSAHRVFNYTKWWPQCSGRTAKNAAAVRQPDRLHTAHSRPLQSRQNQHKQSQNKVSFPTLASLHLRKSRNNSFSKGWGKTRSLFQGEALSGLLRYYLDVSAASGQPQFGEKRTICCEERDFIELQSNGSGEKTKRPSHSTPSVIFFDRKLYRTLLQFLFSSNSISLNGL